MRGRSLTYAAATPIQPTPWTNTRLTTSCIDDVSSMPTPHDQNEERQEHQHGTEEQSTRAEPNRRDERDGGPDVRSFALQHSIDQVGPE